LRQTTHSSEKVEKGRFYRKATVFGEKLRFCAIIPKYNKV
jgi:hypothetical protein